MNRRSVLVSIVRHKPSTSSVNFRDDYQSAVNHKKQQKDCIAEAAVLRGGQTCRQTTIEDAAHAEGQACYHPAMRIDDCRNSRVGGPNQRQAFLNGANAGLEKMLIWPRCVAVPCVVG